MQCRCSWSYTPWPSIYFISGYFKASLRCLNFTSSLANLRQSFGISRVFDCLILKCTIKLVVSNFSFLSNTSHNAGKIKSTNEVIILILTQYKKKWSPRTATRNIMSAFLNKEVLKIYIILCRKSYERHSCGTWGGWHERLPKKTPNVDLHKSFVRKITLRGPDIYVKRTPSAVIAVPMLSTLQRTCCITSSFFLKALFALHWGLEGGTTISWYF